MANTTGADGNRHFSGVYVRMVVQFLQETHGSDVLRTILDRAGETRSLETLFDDSAWASYEQIRRLFEATASVLGDSESLIHAAASTAVGSGSSAEIAQALQDLGSPDSLLETAVSMDSALGLSTIRLRDGERIGPGEWVVRERFTEGFEPFPEFCTFMNGLFSLIPTLFGLPDGNVVEEDCCCRGAEYCSYLITWSEGDRLTQERSYFETRSQLLQSRLETLQQTVAGVISAPDPDAALCCVMEAASRALYAHSYILVTDPDLPMRQRLLLQGMDESEGRRIASELSTPEGRAAPGRLCVEVATNHERYGWLAALDPGNRTFLDQERQTITSYASLAAAALDSAAAVAKIERALEEARRQATTASSLLELSRDLAALTNPEQVAAHLAGAIRRVVDCDQSLVFLSGDDDAAVAAVDGFPERIEAQLHGIQLPLAAMELLGPELTYLDAEDVAALSAL